MKKRTVSYYQISNVYYPVIQELKPKGFDDKWIKSLKSIKEWAVKG